MPLSSSISHRALKHTRAIRVEAFARDRGLWDFDAPIADIKSRLFPLDRCCAWSFNNTAVARYYPRWSTKPLAGFKSTSF